MMLRLVLGFLLLLPSLAQAQSIVVGGNVTDAQITEAQAILQASQAKVMQLAVGEFEIIEPAKGLGALLWLPVGDDTLKRVAIPANIPFTTYGIRRGAKEATLYEFPAKPFAWFIVFGLKEAKTTITLVKSADKPELAPIVVDRLDVTVGKPKPPKPPDPDPEPPQPNPIPGQGLRALIITESKDLSNLPAAQIAAINSKEVREYLNSKCVRVDNQPEWRVYDKDTDITRESSIWQDAMKRPRQNLPWLIVSNGKEGYEGPLPANKDELLKKIKQYGEVK